MGVPMVFVRLAGCDVGCPLCDTDYSTNRKAVAKEIAEQAHKKGNGIHWAYITGGEPTIHELPQLIQALRAKGFRVGLATAGERAVQMGSHYGGVDYLYVSPHNPDKWVQTAGTDLNIVPGLNGHSLSDFIDKSELYKGAFTNRFVTPCEGIANSMKAAIQWVMEHPDWRLGCQAHKTWGIP